MSWWRLVLANLGRKKARTLFTLLSIFVAFVLYGVLIAVRTGFGQGIDLAGLERLVMIHKVSLIQPLPYSYLGRIEADPGVEKVTHANWFGGIYQDPKNFFSTMAVDPESYLEVYDEVKLSPEQREAWLRTRTGAIVGAVTAAKYGFEIGDRIPLTSPIYRRGDGGETWEFTVEGIFDSDVKGFDKTPLLFHYEYLKEGSPNADGIVGWYVLEVKDPDQAAVVAERLDKRFANSAAETKTSTEKAFVQGFANQAGNIAAMVAGIIAVVFFTMLLVSGNAMAQAVRERTRELGVLKTLGFSSASVTAMVLAESLTLAVVGGGLGLGLVTYLTATKDLGGSMLPSLFIPWPAVVTGALLIVATGLLAGAVPAFQALRLRIVDALARRA